MPDRIRRTRLPPRPSAARLPYLGPRRRPAVASAEYRGRCGREARARRAAPRSHLRAVKKVSEISSSGASANHRAGVHHFSYGEDAIELKVFGDLARLAVGAFRKHSLRCGERAERM